MEENNKTNNQKFYNKHKYNINIIDIYFKLVGKFTLIDNDENNNLITDRYRNAIKHLIELNGYKSEPFFELNLPFTIYCYDNSYDLFFALKLITLEKYLIEPLLNFQYQYSPNKDLFVNRLEFYVLENIENNNYFDNTKVKEIVVNWIVRKRVSHYHEYTDINNTLHLSPVLEKHLFKRVYQYPNHIGNQGIKVNKLFKLFKTGLYFDTFIKSLIGLKIIDNKCNWKVKNQQSKILVNLLSTKGQYIIYHREKETIADAIIEFFNLKYSKEYARKNFKETKYNRDIYNSLAQVIKELTTENGK